MTQHVHHHAFHRRHEDKGQAGPREHLDGLHGEEEDERREAMIATLHKLSNYDKIFEVAPDLKVDPCLVIRFSVRLT